MTTTTRHGRALRVLAVFLCICTLIVGSVVVAEQPAQALTRPIVATDQTHYSRYSLDSLRAQGYTWRGVVVAVLDGRIDTTIPELAGAHIELKSPCVPQRVEKSDRHATFIAQVLVARDFGLAPDATIYNYEMVREALEGEGDCSTSWSRPGDLAQAPNLIEQAINDGADIISISSTFSVPESQEMRWALARAVVNGVIVVASMGNEGIENDPRSMGSWSGVVGVGALEPDGTVASYSSWGDGVSVAAIGEVMVRSSIDGNDYIVNGTSMAAPVVAGTLALGKQRFGREATTEQILQALVATGSGAGQWNNRTGYGEIDPAALLSSDPTALSNRHPFIGKGNGAKPTVQEISDYADGVVNPRVIMNDPSYVYRGTDEKNALRDGHKYPVHLGTSPRYHRD